MIYRRFFNVPTYRFRSPWDELHRLRQQLDQMFETRQPRSNAKLPVYFR